MIPRRPNRFQLCQKMMLRARWPDFMGKLRNKALWHRRARYQLQHEPLCAMCLQETDRSAPATGRRTAVQDQGGRRRAADLRLSAGPRRSQAAGAGARSKIAQSQASLRAMVLPWVMPEHIRLIPIRVRWRIQPWSPRRSSRKLTVVVTGALGVAQRSAKRLGGTR
jgi:hypothetical protein